MLKDVYHEDAKIPELAGTVAERLAALAPFPGEDDINEERDEIVGEFELLSEDPDATVEEFDEIMWRLYDWGDTKLDGHWNGKKCCWIETQ